ncbi:MAG: alpha/beta hydrolase [Dermatophilaceae bacterium]
MPLTSLRFLALCIGLAISIPVALVILWRRAPRNSRWALPAVLVGVLVAQGAAVAAVAVHVNRDYGFYPTWSSLFGSQVTPPPVLAEGTHLGLHGVAGSSRPVLPVTSGSASDTGRYERITLKGAKSGISQTVMTWLPPQYNDRRYAQTRFPVVMVLGAAQVHIPYVVDRLDFANTASREIRSGRVAPFVAVFPEINVALPVETECTDYPGSTQAFTWLNQDVRNWATGALRVATDARHWSVIGWSTGGYCAALLHLRAPERFGAAASVEGYFTPAPDRSTGNLGRLLNQSQTLAHESSPTWLIEHRRPRAVHLLVMTSDKDPQSRPQALEFLRRERNVPGIQPYLVRNLGHSLDAYQAALAPILGWLATVADA